MGVKPILSRPRVLLITVVCALVGLVAALTAASTSVRPITARGATTLDHGSVSVLGGAGPELALSTSRSLFTSSPIAVVVNARTEPATWTKIAQSAVAAHAPVLTAHEGNADAISAELRRLGVDKVFLVNSPPGVDVGSATTVAGLPEVGDVEPQAPTAGAPLVLTTPSTPLDSLATAQASGAQIVRAAAADPRADGETVRILRTSSNRPIRAIGSEFGSDAQLAERISIARTQTELPGGGQLVFPGRRFLALYGSPGAPSLGPLGRQNLPGSINRAKGLAAQYQPLSPVPVVPTFEIIVTVASSEPGIGNNYTTMIDPREIRPWVIAARDAGVYVTLDLQPGRMDFLTQARQYADLLREPNVGLALDPEWRLKPDQVHLTQIGSVDADEVNRTSQWLAELTRSNKLPQKAFVLHEFDPDMLGRRDRIITDRPELATVIHADGHGIPSVKMATWRRMNADLPPRVWMGWKNFYTEDKPPFSPAQTMAVGPTPYFISYQ